ncbi:fructose-2,6-bisphosphatase TIGAR-like isoform X2 [Acanthaster planci]|uniref:Fructose-2,6-bisphosphatase TIGAR n=1 Tax=Acanthaster planci TaxID=133434 RepID=A0A8B7XFZ2_ACAPL|nr:fructose-2,6-bisphosphatase TIGAR-like isoform X2 [Acanthaster planci]
MARFILTLVRHGQTIYNQDGIIQGQMDVPLSEEGRKQIWLLAKALEQHRFTKIFASDLQRAREGYGRLEGIPVKEYQGHAKKGKQHKQFTPEGGETIDQVRKRAVSFFKELCDDFLEGGALQSAPKKCAVAKKLLNSEEGSNSPEDAQTAHPKSSLASSEVSASNEVDIPPVEFTVGPLSQPGSDEEEAGDRGDRQPTSEALTAEVQACHPPRPQQSGARSPHYHRRSPLSNQYAPNVTLSQSSMRRGGAGPEEGTIEVSSSEGSLGSQDTEDDLDGDAELDGMVADVLVVAHGVLLREMMRYFIEDLNCFVPKGQNLANRVTFNTGMSRFQVDLLDGFPKMECLTIHQIDHLHQP